jgi:hypothetical protein
VILCARQASMSELLPSHAAESAVP